MSLSWSEVGFFFSIFSLPVSRVPFVFQFLIHFQLIFLCKLQEINLFSFFYMWIPNFPRTICWNAFFLCFFWVPFSKSRWLSQCVFTLGSFVLSHRAACLSDGVTLPLSLWLCASLKSDMVVPPASSFLLRITLIYLSFLLPYDL